MLSVRGMPAVAQASRKSQGRRPSSRKGSAVPWSTNNSGTLFLSSDEANGIIRSPSLLVSAQIPLESGAGPTRRGWLTYRSKCRYGSEAIRVFQRQRNRAMAPHRMAENALPGHIDREISGDDARKFVGYIARHPVVLRIGVLRSIEIESSAGSKLPIVLVVGHVVPARTRVGANNRDAQFRSDLPILALVHYVLTGAGEPREVPEHRNGRFFRLRRQERRKRHVARARLACVSINALDSPKALGNGNRFHQVTSTERIDLPSRVSSNASLILFRQEIGLSLLVFPSMYRSTINDKPVSPLAQGPSPYA